MIRAGRASLLFLLACTESTGPSPEPRAAILVLRTSSQILRVDADGEDTVTLLTEPNEHYSGLSPSPTGDIILFNRLSPGGTTPGPVYQISPTGQDLAPFPAPGDSPLWSPDGSRIGWSFTQYAGTTILLTDPNGNFPDTIGLAETFAWSADGRRLAITYRPSNTDQEVGTIDLDGDRQRVNRTNSTTDDRLPSWSPDGTLIAFYSDRPPVPGLYLMNADGANPRFLAPATVFTPPRWSPDGSRLAILDYGDSLRPVALRVFRPSGSELQVPAELARTPLDFEWSPSGANALVAVSTSGRVHVYIASASFDRVKELNGDRTGADVAWLVVP